MAARRSHPKQVRFEEPTEIDQSGVRRGYALMLALACAAVVVMFMRLHDSQRLVPALQALGRGELVVFVDGVAPGNVRAFLRRTFPRQLVAVMPPKPLPDLPPEIFKPGARPPRVPTTPYLLNAPRLDGFFQSLRELDNKRRKKVRMAYFGTSEIGHDRVTSQVRRQLQERFGDGGKGFVLIDRTWAILDHRDVRWEHERANWKSYSIRTGVVPDGHYGLGGVVVENTGAAWAEYATLDEDHGVEAGYHPFPAGTAWSKIEVLYQGFEGGGTFKLDIDGSVIKELNTQSDTLVDKAYVAKVTDGPHRLRLDTSTGKVRMYGATFERDEGFVLDALMVIGAWGHSIANFEPEHFRAQLDRRDPQLLVFQFGAKEALRNPELSAKQLKEFRTGFIKSIQKAMASREDTSCLVISPKDQGLQTAGRIITRPAIPALVKAAQEVAQEVGCAFFNLYEAMGGEGTARRWFHQTPRLVSSDLGHLEEAGSIRIGDLLSDLFLDEYDAFLQWEQGPSREHEAALVEVDLPAPEENETIIFSSVTEDGEVLQVTPCTQAGKTAVDCRDPTTYIQTNERGQPLWADHIRDLGGAYIGVGADHNYNLIAEARSRWAWLVDYDPTVVRLHQVLQAVILARNSPTAFVAAFAPKNRKATRALVTEHLKAASTEAAERDQVLAMLDDIGKELYAHFRRSRRPRPLFGSWGWLRHPEKYAYIRALYRQNRILALRANLLGNKALRSISRSATKMGVPVRVLYLSSTESQWKRLPNGYRSNIRRLPFDRKTVVLRTLPGRKWNKKRGFSKWHYVIQSGQNWQKQLANRRTKRVDDVMSQRAALTNYLSRAGPSESAKGRARVAKGNPRRSAQ